MIRVFFFFYSSSLVLPPIEWYNYVNVSLLTCRILISSVDQGTVSTKLQFL